MLFDTHLHLIDFDRLSYPWLADVPALNKPSTFEAYSQKAKRLGISGCLHMEVDVPPGEIARETEMVRDLMTQPGSLMRGAISSCRPENADFPAHLETAQANATVLGFRRILHTEPDALCQSDQFRQNIKRLSGTGLTFDLCTLPRQIPLATKLVDLCPDVQFILDHCGVPDVKTSEMQPWSDAITDIAKRPNVVGKISGIVAYAAPETWTLETLRPYVDHMVRAFGHDRLVWGSDSPVCELGGGLETWVATTWALTNGWLSEDRDALFQGNAKKIWRLNG